MDLRHKDILSKLFGSTWESKMASIMITLENVYARYESQAATGNVLQDDAADKHRVLASAIAEYDLNFEKLLSQFKNLPLTSSIRTQWYVDGKEVPWRALIEFKNDNEDQHKQYAARVLVLAAVNGTRATGEVVKINGHACTAQLQTHLWNHRRLRC